MREPCSRALWRCACAALVGACVAAVLARPATAQVPDDLARLNVPSKLLPTDCRLRVTKSSMFKTNPAFVTDPVVLGVMHSLVFGTGAVPNEAEITSRAAHVEAGYAAAYEEQNGSPEIGVFALRMKKPASEEPASGTPARGGRILKGHVAIFYWSDAIGSRADRGCLDVVRKHIESLTFK